MQWIETSGKDVQEAIESALFQLGITRAELEYTVVSEPRRGLLGIMKSEARIRARVKPATYKAKEPPRRRSKSAGGREGSSSRPDGAKGRSEGSKGEAKGAKSTGGSRKASGMTSEKAQDGGARSGGRASKSSDGSSARAGSKAVSKAGGDRSGGSTAGASEEPGTGSRRRSSTRRDGSAQAVDGGAGESAAGDGSESGESAKKQRAGTKKAGTPSRSAGSAGRGKIADKSTERAPSGTTGAGAQKEGNSEPMGREDGNGNNGSDRPEFVSLDAQADVAREFIEGLLDELDQDGEVVIEKPEEDTVVVSVQGDELGLLIGPKAATLSAVQELTRTVVQRRTGATNGRLFVDVGGYRAKRRAALEVFATKIAGEVIQAGEAKALEPMNPADRKVIHDTINAIDGVATKSEGEEPRRCVVVMPDRSAAE